MLSMTDALHWLEHTPVAVFVSHSTGGFSALLSVHILAVAIVFGMIAMVDLRLIGIAARHSAVTVLCREALPWTWSAFALSALTGMLLFTAQPARMTEFYTQVLGLHLSDTIHHDLVTFLNAGPGDHHVFGFISSTHRGFHHASFEVPSIDAIAIGADRMRARGREPGWGLGRHTIGSNFFHYNPDPWGSWIEWFSDIDQIDDCWVANDWDVPPHLWGTPPPETFLANSEPAPTKE